MKSVEDRWGEGGRRGRETEGMDWKRVPRVGEVLPRIKPRDKQSLIFLVLDSVYLHNVPSVLSSTPLSSTISL